MLKVNNPEYINSSYSRISWDDYFMNMAYLVRLRSHDSETAHGAVFVRNNRIISTGFNGFPPASKDTEIPNVRKDGAKYPFMNHAEESAIFNAAKEGVSLNGCTAYITGLPCSLCARKLVSVGIFNWVVGNVGYVCSEEDSLLRQYWIDTFNVSVKQFDGEIFIGRSHPHN